MFAPYFEFEITVIDAINPNKIIINDHGIRKKRKNRALRKLSRLFGLSVKSEEEIEVLSEAALRDKVNRLKVENDHLKGKLEAILTCPICNELVSDQNSSVKFKLFQKYDSKGARYSVKLRCVHIVCNVCAEAWLMSQGWF